MLLKLATASSDIAVVVLSASRAAPDELLLELVCEGAPSDEYTGGELEF